MFKLSLTACSFYLKKTNKQKNAFYLNKDIITENESKTITTNVKDMFCDFFSNYKIPVSDGKRMKTFHCEYSDEWEGENKEFKFFYVLIKSGNYGNAADVLDNKSRKVKFHISPNHTTEMPFYLYVAIPKDNKEVKAQKGILIFQNVGSFGIKTITTDYLNEFFSSKYGISLTCRSISPKLFLEKMISPETVKKIVLIKNEKSADSADNAFPGYGQETRALSHLSFKKIILWNLLYKEIQHFCNEKNALFEFEKKSYDGLKLVVKIGGNERTINMSRLDYISIIEEIHPENIMNADGSINREPLIDHFTKVAKDYLSEMVFEL